MLIRSQNKELLINCDNFIICVEREYNLKYIKTIKNGKELELGLYSSYKNMLKVLDIIALKIQSENNNYIYQMPQDNEVE